MLKGENSNQRKKHYESFSESNFHAAIFYLANNDNWPCEHLFPMDEHSYDELIY